MLDVEDNFSNNDQEFLACWERKKSSKVMKLEYDRITKKTMEMMNPIDNDMDIITFPIKLYHILQIIPKYGLGHIITWRKCGRYFQIKDRDMFISSIAPIFFGFKKFASFQRQLNLYGFKHVSVKLGLGEGVYYHDQFIQNHVELCLSMNRINRNSKDKLCVRQEHDDIDVSCHDNNHMNVSTLIRDRDNQEQSSPRLKDHHLNNCISTIQHFNSNGYDAMNTSVNNNNTNSKPCVDYYSCSNNHGNHQGRQVSGRHDSMYETNTVQEGSNLEHHNECHPMKRRNIIQYDQHEEQNDGVVMEPIDVFSDRNQCHDYVCDIDTCHIDAMKMTDMAHTPKGDGIIMCQESSKHGQESSKISSCYNTEQMMKRPKLDTTDDNDDDNHVHMIHSCSSTSLRHDTNHFNTNILPCPSSLSSSSYNNNNDITFIDQALMSLYESQKIVYQQMQMLYQSRRRRTITTTASPITR